MYQVMFLLVILKAIISAEVGSAETAVIPAFYAPSNPTYLEALLSNDPSFDAKGPRGFLSSLQLSGSGQDSFSSFDVDEGMEVICDLYSAPRGFLTNLFLPSVLSLLHLATPSTNTPRFDPVFRSGALTPNLEGLRRRYRWVREVDHEEREKRRKLEEEKGKEKGGELGGDLIGDCVTYFYFSTANEEVDDAVGSLPQGAFLGEGMLGALASNRLYCDKSTIFSYVS